MQKKFILNLSGLYDALEQRNEISTIKVSLYVALLQCFTLVYNAQPTISHKGDECPIT